MSGPPPAPYLTTEALREFGDALRARGEAEGRINQAMMRLRAIEGRRGPKLRQREEEINRYAAAATAESAEVEPSPVDHALSGFVYVIEAEGTDRAKVGFTAGPVATRLRQLQTSSPFRLRELFWTAGDLALEQACHEALAGNRADGGTEWFTGVERVLATVRDVAACPVVLS